MIRVTCAIIQHKNRLLITQRGAGSDHPFLWELPGGKIDAAETEEECIQREIDEELEMKIEIVKRLLPVQFDYGFKKIELIPFLCKVSDDEFRLNEHIQAKWILWEETGAVEFLEADEKLVQKNRNELEKYFREQMNQP